MTIDRSFVEKIEELSNVNTYDIDGRAFSSKVLHQIQPACPAFMTVHTLTSVVDYCTKLKDETKGFFIQIVSHDSVVVCSHLNDGYRERENYLRAELIADGFKFGRQIDAEQFIIALQSQFVQSETTAALLKIVGNLSAESERKTLDDGVTQQVTTRTGLAKYANVPLPNPVVLSPFRTFQEVEQPESKFVFRISANVSETPTCALYEADGGEWRNTAIANIAHWLSVRLNGVVILA